MNLHFTVADTGIGIPAAKRTLPFEAFAQADGTTTRTHGGTGLGLAIATQVVRKMGGRIRVESVDGARTTLHFTTLLLVATSGSGAVAPAAVRATRSLRILLAKAILEEHGHSVFVAKNGREAVEANARESFDLIPMDVQMPEMDAFEATHRIRESEKPGDRERCLAAGMADYLSKPLQPSVLLERISACDAVLS